MLYYYIVKRWKTTVVKLKQKENTAMKKRNCRGPVEGSDLDFLGPLQDLIRQCRSGARTKAQLVDFNEGRNPFEKKKAAFAESVRTIQIEHLKSRGYSLNEADIPLPDAAKFQLGLALLVDYETPIDEQCKKLGITNYLNLDYHNDLHQKPQGCWGWIYGVEDGKSMLGKSPNSCIEEFGKNKRRGLMTAEGLALYRENLDLLKDHYVDLSGSRCDESGDGVPGLGLGGGQPELGYCWASYACGYPGWGSASASVV